MLLIASSVIINKKLLAGQQLDFIVITNAHPEDCYGCQTTVKKKRKRDEGLLQLEKIYNEDDEFEEG